MEKLTFNELIGALLMARDLADNEGRYPGYGGGYGLIERAMIAYSATRTWRKTQRLARLMLIAIRPKRSKCWHLAARLLSPPSRTAMAAADHPSLRSRAQETRLM